jgi:ABC-2 type transport system permease protein
MSAYAGTAPMLGLTVRRERVHATAWYVLAGLLIVVVGAGVAGTYPTEVARAALADSVDTNGGELFLIGPLRGTDVGSLMLWRVQGIAAITLGLASTLVVVRNTRGAEEAGRIELLGAAAVGRAAAVEAALAVAGVGSLASGLIVSAGFLALGGAGLGSLLVGLQVFAIGLLFAGVAGLLAQLTRSARAATGISVGVLAVLYLARGVADATGAPPWTTPLGWTSGPFTDNDAVAILPLVVLAALLMTIALRVAAGRDLGAGLLSDRPGPTRASATLRGPFSLTLRLARGTIAGWTLSALVVGLLIGAVAGTVDQQVHLDVSGAGIGLAKVAAYLAPEIVTLLALTTVLRMRGDITSGRAETLLSQPLRRPAWLFAHVAAAAVSSVLVLLAFGLGLGIALAGATGDPTAIAAWTGGELARTPSVWLLLGVTTLVLATAPRAAAAVGFTLLAIFIALELGVEARAIAPTSLYGSPYALVAQLPDGPAQIRNTLLLLLAALLLVVAATRTIRRLDIR